MDVAEAGVQNRGVILGVSLEVRGEKENRGVFFQRLVPTPDVRHHNLPMRNGQGSKFKYEHTLVGVS